MAQSEPLSDSDMIEVRRSNVHGLGVFATRAIPKGTRIIEYMGERVSHAEADRRYEDKDANDSHTFLFIVDSKAVIDAGVDGNDARFINHSCYPNCESVIESRRVYIETIRDIAPGDELTYDYQIQREDDDPENVDEVFACRCGFPQCRGTMLWPTERKPKRKSRAAGGKSSRGAGSHRSSSKRSSSKRSSSKRNSSKRSSLKRSSSKRSSSKRNSSKRTSSKRSSSKRTSSKRSSSKRNSSKRTSSKRTSRRGGAERAFTRSTGPQSSSTGQRAARRSRQRAVRRRRQ